MAVLEVKDLTKSFQDHLVIKGISFQMEEGEILGILGPNGAGKTTTLQMLIGVLAPTSGQINVFGKDISIYKSEISQSINFSSTYVDLPWRLTVKQNLVWTSYLYDIKDRKKRLSQIIELFRLEKIWYKPIAELSAGQKTRVNLARSMINYPRLLLLDEPTASLDPEVAAYIREFFKNQREKFGKSIILTSHNMSEVEDLCDRVIVLKDGLIHGNDTPAGLAKKIDDSILNLRITKNMPLLDALLKRHRLTKAEVGGITTIKIKEKILPLFLYEVTKQNIHYSEITISKPTLEDYFLKVAREKIS